MNAAKYLSKKDFSNFLEISYLALNCQSKNKFKNIILRLRKLILFDKIVCGYFNKTFCGYADIEIGIHSVKSIYEVLNIKYPDEWIENCSTKEHHHTNPADSEFLDTFKVQNWRDALTGSYDHIVISEASSFGLKDGFLYGIHDLDSSVNSFLWLSGKNVENNERIEFIINYAITFLSVALKRILSEEKENIDFSLTKREIEILDWLKEGKTSWEVSVILGIAQDTVNFHVKNIKTKLNAMNTTHAVAIAVGERLVSF